MAIDITNHLIPWAVAKQMQADAWDEGRLAEVDYMDDYEDTPNPYRENK